MKTGTADMLLRNHYREYLRRLDGRAILERYGAVVVREDVNKDGTTELIHSCLIDRVEPHHANGDAHPSASLNPEKGLYCCYSGGWSGDLLHLLAKLNDEEVADVLPRASEFFRGTAEDSESLRAEAERVFRGPGICPVEPAYYSERILDGWAFTHPYLSEERGVDHETCCRLRVGWDARTNRITFPAWLNGRLVGWQGRAIPERPGQWPGTVPPEPKYKGSKGFPRSQTLFGLGEVIEGRGVNRVVVVESPMSVAKAVSLGFPNTVATWGAKTSSYQAEMLRRYRHVTVWFDDDTAGRNSELKLLKELHRGYAKVVSVTPDEKRDLGDCTSAAEVQSKLDAAIPAVVRLAHYDLAERYKI